MSPCFSRMSRESTWAAWAFASAWVTLPSVKARCLLLKLKMTR
jgi:hypothetical protein